MILGNQILLLRSRNGHYPIQPGWSLKESLAKLCLMSVFLKMLKDGTSSQQCLQMDDQRWLLHGSWVRSIPSSTSAVQGYSLCLLQRRVFVYNGGNMLNTDYEQAFQLCKFLQYLTYQMFLFMPFGKRMYISYVYFTGVCQKGVGIGSSKAVKVC